MQKIAAFDQKHAASILSAPTAVINNINNTVLTLAAPRNPSIRFFKKYVLKHGYKTLIINANNPFATKLAGFTKKLKHSYKTYKRQ